MRRRSAWPLPILLLALVLGAVRVATAQVADTVLGNKVLVRARVGPPFRDSIRVDLHQHGQYRIAVWPAATEVRVVPVAAHQEAAYAPVVRAGSDSKPTIIEVYPKSSGPHLVLVSTGGRSDTVQLSVWSDSLAEAQTAAKREREWGIGLVLGAGYHTGYQTAAHEPPPQSSADFEGGVLFGSSGWFALEVGVTSDGRYTGVTRVVYVFVEPRIRLGQWSAGNHAMTFELVGRAAQGAQDSVSADPGYLGLGALLTYHLDHRTGVRGWVAGLELLEAQIGNVPSGPNHSFTRVGLSLSWLP